MGLQLKVKSKIGLPGVAICGLATVSLLSGSALADLIFEDEAAQTDKVPATRSETLRQSRVLEENRNNEVLAERIEQNRLKDELNRADRMLEIPVPEKKTETAVTVEAQTVLPSPTVVAAQPLRADDSFSDETDDSISSVSKSSMQNQEQDENPYEGHQFRIGPRGGLSNLLSSVYDLESKYSVGAELDITLSSLISFRAGYTFSRYSVALGAASIVYPNGFYPRTYLQSVQLNDNVFDFGLRGHVFGMESKFRPFIGGGAAHRRGYINYDHRTRDLLRMYSPDSARDVEISGFLGYLESGFDLKLTDHVLLTGLFRFFKPLNSHQSNPLSPNLFLNPAYGPAWINAVDYNSDARSESGSAMAKANFFQVMGGLTIEF